MLGRMPIFRGLLLNIPWYCTIASEPAAAVAAAGQIVERLGKTKKWSQLEQHWETMRDDALRPDITTYNSLLTYFAKGGLWDRVAEVQEMMSLLNVPPDTETYAILVHQNALADRFVDVKHLEEEFRKSGLPYTRRLGAVFVNAAMIAGTIDAPGAVDWLNKAGHPADLQTFNLLIHTCALRGQWDKVEALKVEMRGCNVNGDAETYNSIMLGYERVVDWEACERISWEMEVHGVIPNRNTFHIMIKLCENLQQWEDVEKMHCRMKEVGIVPSLKIFNLLLRAYAASGQVEKVRDVTMEMIECGVSPDVHTYNDLLSAYQLRKNHSAMESLFADMDRRDIAPNVTTYARMASMLCRTGRCDEARRVVERMKVAGVPCSVPFVKILNRHCGEEFVKEVVMSE